MGATFRVIDTGVREGRLNIAIGHALIEAHQTGRIGDTLRFLQFPPTALVGRHQDLSAEIKLDHCRANGIGVVRRITGGGAIYFDENQLGWELVFSRRTLAGGALADVTARICTAAAAGLSNLGIAARYRPPNDIEVDGAKISGTGGYFDGDTLFYQGTVLVDMDPAAMFAALNMALPEAGAQADRPRFTTLKALLGEAPPMADIRGALVDGFCRTLDLTAVPAPLGAAEEQAAQLVFDETIGTDDFVHEIDEPDKPAGVHTGTVRTAGGHRVAAHLRLDGPARDRIREVVLSGDFIVTPPRFVLDLEARLRGTALNDLDAAIAEYFAASAPGIATLGPDDFANAIRAAANR